MMPRAKVFHVRMTVDEAFTLILSVGAVRPEAAVPQPLAVE
jgi:uncharacterized membrane protein